MQLELPDSSYGRQTSVRCKKTTCTKIQLQTYECTTRFITCPFSKKCKMDDIRDVQAVDESQKGSVCAGGSGKMVIGKVINVASSEAYVSCVMCYCKL